MYGITALLFALSMDSSQIQQASTPKPQVDIKAAPVPRPAQPMPSERRRRLKDQAILSELRDERRGRAARRS